MGPELIVGGFADAVRKGMRITILAAADDEWGIGRANGLPWRCPADLAHFKARTMGKHLLMGRTTYEGLPVALHGRSVHVVSSKGPRHLTSVERALLHLSCEGVEEIVIAGGGRVYAEALAWCTHAEVTRIPGRHGCDTFMPDLEENGWAVTATARLVNDINIQNWEQKT